MPQCFTKFLFSILMYIVSFTLAYILLLCKYKVPSLFSEKFFAIARLYFIFFHISSSNSLSFYLKLTFNTTASTSYSFKVQYISIFNSQLFSILEKKQFRIKNNLTASTSSPTATLQDWEAFLSPLSVITE